jgi:hypothetical protein
VLYGAFGVASNEELMLTEEESTRIRAEEIFRLEVRRELAASKPGRSVRDSFWSLLNSSFILWFLSSVVLASVTTAFTYYQSSRGEQIRKAELEGRLDTEISNRISLALAGLRTDQKSIEHGKSYPANLIYRNTQSYLDNFFITDPSNRRDFSIYPEYRQRTFRSLIFELRTVVDSSMRPELTDVLAGYEQLLDLGSLEDTKGGKTTRHQESLKAVKNAVHLLDRQLTKPRWRSRM